jgi:methyl-accepting chemotaxis protein
MILPHRNLVFRSSQTAERTAITRRATVDSAPQAVVDLDLILRRAESGDGMVGALLNGDGHRLDADVQATAPSAHTAAEAVAALAQQCRNAHGAIPELMENREYARELMDNLRQSSADLEQILHKINSGQGFARQARE